MYIMCTVGVCVHLCVQCNEDSQKKKVENKVEDIQLSYKKS